MSGRSLCPGRQELEQLLLGQVAEAEAEELERHFGQCEGCLRAARSLGTDDPLVTVVRASSHAARTDDTEVPTILIDRLRGLRQQLLGLMPASSPDGPVGPAVPVSGEPSSIGPYRVQRLLGAGGMGEVYLALQQWPRRQVALKIIQAGPRASRGRLARFRAEAEAIARLGHPHIVRLYDVGEHEGRPYFTMEYVEGGNLAERVAQAPMTARSAARLLEILALAVHAAHEQGIIHRDLKPSNVLLAADGTPKVSDFGLAKQVEAPGEGDALGCQTESGAILGTPRYMAPEQAAGRGALIGPAVDIYALGAILYEVLTGRPPFQAADVLETLEQVRSREPIPPGRLLPGLPADLGTICLKCLEKEPTRRYATAADLADDLERFLREQPIRARPAGVLVRVRKWARRQPAQAGLVAVSGLALAALVVGALVHDARLQTQTRRAEAAEQRARANYRHARDTVSGMLERLDDPRWGRAAQLYELKKEQTEDALAFYKAVALERDDRDPAVQLDVATAYLQAGLIEYATSRFDDAGQSLEKARQLFERLVAGDPDNLDYQRPLARCWNHLGHLHALRRGTGDDPLRCYRAALAIAEQMWRERPEDSVIRGYVLSVSHNVANALFAAGRLGEARARRDKALQLARDLASDHTAVAEWNLAVALVNLGESHLADGLPRKAEEAFGEAETLLERLHREKPEDVTLAANLAEAHADRAEVMVGTGRVPQAIDWYTRAIALEEDDQRREPLVMEINSTLSGLYTQRALAYGVAGDETKATADWSRAAAVAEKSPDVLARLAGALARAHLGNGEQAVARIEAACPVDQLFQHALVYAACATAAAKDERVAASDRAERAKRYTDGALKLLKQSHDAGMLRNPAQQVLLRQGPGFAAIRQRPEFETLLRDLKEPVGP
jgi:serine/threonine-protein kinase